MCGAMGGPVKLSDRFPRKNDIIYFYTRSKNNYFNHLYDDIPEYLYKRARKDSDGRLWVDQRLGVSGVVLKKLREEGRTFKTKNGGERRKQYLGEMKGMPLSNVWDIPIINSQSKERTGYPTQKPLKLLERIITASSNQGDIVLDPFCGCATTCVAAEKLGRQWIGVDISIKAYELVQTRIKDEVYAEGLLKGEGGNLPAIHFSTDPPHRTDRPHDAIEQKYLYIISHPLHHGWYKVGIARDVKSRFNSYQTGDPQRQFKLEYSLLTPHYRALEHHIHTTLENKFEWCTPISRILSTRLSATNARTNRAPDRGCAGREPHRAHCAHRLYRAPDGQNPHQSRRGVRCRTFLNLDTTGSDAARYPAW